MITNLRQSVVDGRASEDELVVNSWCHEHAGQAVSKT